MITETTIDLPVRTVYDQWTQFEDFPLFMDHVKSVEQLDETTLFWKVKISGISKEWKAEITEQTPDQRIAWTAVDGAKNSGVVTFHPLNDDQTRVVLQLEMEPEGFVEKVADWGGYMSDRAKKDLEDFKEFIENRGSATGSYRGEVKRDPHHGEHQLRQRFEQMSDEELRAAVDERGLSFSLDEGRSGVIDRLVGHDREQERKQTVSSD